jgi:ankyrin repeat protein
MNGRIDIVRLLVEKGAYLHVRDEEQFTPLDWATENGHPEIVEMLKDAKKLMTHASRVTQRQESGGDKHAGQPSHESSLGTEAASSADVLPRSKPSRNQLATKAHPLPPGRG